MGRGVELILAVLTVWLAWVPFSPHAALLRRIPIGSTVGANVQVSWVCRTALVHNNRVYLGSYAL
jgi:hypothetical protein